MLISCNYAARCTVAPIVVQAIYRIISYRCIRILFNNSIIIISVSGSNDSFKFTIFIYDSAIYYFVTGIGIVNFNTACNGVGVNAAQLKGEVICRFITYSTVNIVVGAAVQHNQLAATLISIGNSTGQVNAPAACLINIFGKDFVGFGVIPCFDVINKLTIFINSTACTLSNKIRIRHILAVITCASSCILIIIFFKKLL